MMIFRKLIQLFRDHLKNLDKGFEPLTEVQDISQVAEIDHRKLNSRYLLAYFVTWFSIVDFCYQHFKYGVFLPEESENFFRLVTKTWPANLEQRDVIGLGAYGILPGYYLPLFVEKWPQKLMYFAEGRIFFDGKYLPSKLSKTLLAYHSRIQKPLNLLKVCTLSNTFIVAVSGHFIGEIFLSPTITLWRAVCLGISPWYWLYIAYALVYANFFWLNIQFLHRKSEYLIKSFQGMTKKIRWTVRLMNEIRSSNRFWSKYMSVTLLIYSLEVLYITFTMLTAPTVEDKIQLIPLMGFQLAYALFIYIISLNCSRIVVKNLQIHREIRRFNIACGRKKLALWARLKMETFDCYQRFFQKSCFKTINNYTIDFRLFELLASYLFLIALKLYSR